MAKETPIQTVKRLFGSKEKLVESVLDFARDDDEDKSETKERLTVLSNKRLLRLAKRSEEVAKHGGRDSLATKVADAQGRGKDADYVARLKRMTAGRLLDMMGTALQRAS